MSLTADEVRHAEIYASVVDAFYAVPHEVRYRSQWVMADATWKDLRRLFPGQPLPYGADGRIYMLGRPVEIREGAEGIQLEEVAG